LYQGVTGSGTSYITQSRNRRWFELTLCFPNDGPGSSCASASLKYDENEPVNDIVIPAIPYLFSTGLVDLFSNTIAVVPNEFSVTTGINNGLCTFILRRWICEWNTLLPDEGNKIFLQGSVRGEKDIPSEVPIIGGTGNFLNARGKAVVTARQSSSPYSYYWEILPTFTYGCPLFPNIIHLQFQENVGSSAVALSKIGHGITPFPGDTRVFIDDLYLNSKRTAKNDGMATGSCTMLNEDDRHYCEWVIQYPLDGTANGKGSSQIIVVGTVYDSTVVTSTVAVVGGTGIWNGAHGSGTYRPLSNPITDNNVGSPVGILEVEFTYF